MVKHTLKWATTRESEHKRLRGYWRGRYAKKKRGKAFLRGIFGGGRVRRYVHHKR